jgi:hypothetical protein
MKKTSVIKKLVPFGDHAHSGGHTPTAYESGFPTESGTQEKGVLAEAAFDIARTPADLNGRKVPLGHLVNRLNFVNFQESRIQLHFSHRASGRSLLVPAFPLPCSGSVLDCVWAGDFDEKYLRQDYDLDYILVPRGDKLIQSIPEVIEINAAGCRLGLPSASQELNRRRIGRQCCSGITVHMIQNGSTFSGSLFDFSPAAFRVDLRLESSQDFNSIDAALPVHVLFHIGRQTLYSGECRILRTTPERTTPSYVLEPLKQEVQRYRKAEFRSTRQVLNPSPNVIFKHPLTQKRAELKVFDISGSGFSVEEEETASVLMPGLILPEIDMCFGNIFRFTCSVQVVFRKPLNGPENRRRVRCGLALIDVKPQDHVKLLGILHQVKHKNAYVCNEIDQEALWDFLFDSGFIYPAKYALIEKNKQEIKETYTKLYTHNTDIARHFVCQENGVILGHMAAIRFWENSWLIHLHAARTSVLNKAGLIVLDQIGAFTYDSHRIQGMHMDYLVCYYRPDNRFPSRIFGGVARQINDPKGCSLDLFAFVKPSKPAGKRPALPEGWELAPAEAVDLDELRRFYDSRSGGLMLKALDLEAASWNAQALCTEFKSNGFKRERHLFSIKNDGRVKALLIVNISDLGLNLSDLTHCIKALVLDPDSLPSEILTTALRLAEERLSQPELPALIFPMSYVENHSIPFEKSYLLWVFHMHSQSQPYFKYLSRLMKYV